MGCGRSGAPPQLLWPSGRAPRRARPPGVADAAGQPAVPAQLHAGSLGALPLPLGPCECFGLGSSRALVFFRGLDPGCRATFFVAAPWFSTSGNQKSAATVQFRFVGSLKPSRRGCFMKRFSAGVVPGPLCAETRNYFYSLPLQHIVCRLSIRLARCSPIFAICHLLRWSRCARAFDLLICAGVEASPW